MQEVVCDHVMQVRLTSDQGRAYTYFECSAGQCEVAVTTLNVACMRRNANHARGRASEEAMLLVSLAARQPSSIPANMQNT